MLGADPPRRGDGNDDKRHGCNSNNSLPSLARSKSYQGPPRRGGSTGKRGREVLEDITWIVNHPSSWQHQHARHGRPDHLAERDLEDGVPIAGPSTAPATLDHPRAAALYSATMSTDVNTAHASSSLFPNTLISSFEDRRRYNAANRATNEAIRARIPAPAPAGLTIGNFAPRAGSSTRLTDLDSSSSPPSSPRLSSFGYGAGGADGLSRGITRGLGVSGVPLARTVSQPSSATGSSFMLGAGLLSGRSSGSSTSNTGSTSSSRPMSRSASASPSLRAPPPLRRTSSSSSLNGNVNEGAMTPPTTASTGSFSNRNRRELGRASTLPFLMPSATMITDSPSTHAAAVFNHAHVQIPAIQTQMPSPERKRTRRCERDNSGVMDDEQDDF